VRGEEAVWGEAVDARKEVSILTRRKREEHTEFMEQEDD
jgi:hypothetical protein